MYNMAPRSISGTSKAVWTKYADRKFIDEMLVQCRNGKKFDNGFKREVWQAIMVEFNKGAIEETKTIQQLRTRYQTVRN